MPFLRALSGLALACCLGAPLRADLDGRLGVLAGALVSSGALHGRSVAVVDGNPDPQDGLGQAMAGGLRRSLEGAAVAVPAETESPTSKTLVLTLNAAPQADGASVRAELRASGDPDVLWSRNAWIPSEDLPAGSLAGPPPDGDDSGVDVVPRAIGRPRRPPLQWDLSAGYKAFLPLNSTFRSVAGDRLDGLSLGASFQDIVLVDLDAWHADLSGQGTLQSLDYAGVAVAVVAPLRLGPFTLYAGPGGRFGSIQLNDSTLADGSVAFGNNGFEGVAGVKARAGSLGLDLRYGYDFAASYTGYHTLRLGAYYAFGR